MHGYYVRVTTFKKIITKLKANLSVISYLQQVQQLDYLQSSVLSSQIDLLSVVHVHHRDGIRVNPAFDNVHLSKKEK